MEPKEFIKKYGRKLEAREWYEASSDNNAFNEEDFDKAEFKILFMSLSPGDTRSVASTETALQKIVKEDLPGVFVDFCSLPPKADYDLMVENDCPVFFGAASKKAPKDFDFLGLSIVIIPERMNVPRAFLDAGIPLGYHERERLDFPMIMSGGLSGLYGETLYGEFENEKGEKDESLVDMAFLGEAEEKFGLAIQALRKAKAEGADKLGQIKAMVMAVDCLYFPLGYEVEYDDEQERIISNKRKYDWMPPFVYPNISKVLKTVKYNFDEKIINLNGDSTESADIKISEGCVGGNGFCTFCSEGNIMGSWREGSIKDILQVLRNSKKNSGAYQTSFFSFNINMHSKYEQLIVEAAKVAPKLAIINQRADILGASPDSVAICKELGVGKISTALEGIGPRIRNGLYNKNLPFSNFLSAISKMIDNRMMEFKLGGVLSGYENEEDFDLGIAELAEIIKYKDEKGANGRIRINFCLTKEALTPVKGVGLITQNIIESGMNVFGVSNSEVLECHDNGIKNVYRLGTKEGFSISGVEEHPVLVNPHTPEEASSYSMIKDLLPGDTIYVKVGSEAFGDTKYIDLDERDVIKTRKGTGERIEVTEEIGELLGWLAGDGFISQSHPGLLGWCYNKKEEAIKKKHKAVLEGLGYSVSETFQGSADQLRVFNLALYRSFVKIGIKGNCYNKDIPEVILTSGKVVQAAYLRGLFSSDGGVQNYTNDLGNWVCHIRLFTTSKNLSKKSQIMLANFGIMSKVVKEKDNRKNVKYVTYIHSTSRKLFKEEIGFIGEKTDIEIREDYRNEPRIKGFYPVVVSEVNFEGVEKTYGFTIKSAIYVTNGIVSHNTPLVHYEHTPLQFLARKAAERSMTGEKTMGYFLEKAKALGIRTKFNGKGYGTFLEQMFLDGCRKMTKHIVKHSINGLLWYGGMQVKKFQPFVDDILRDYKMKIILGKRPDDWIYPQHRIHIGMQGNMYNEVEKIKALFTDESCLELKPWRPETTHKDSDDITYCVKTQANCNPTCISTVMKKRGRSYFAKGDVDLRKGIKPWYVTGEEMPETDVYDYPDKRLNNYASKWIPETDTLNYHGCNFCETGDEKKSKTKLDVNPDVRVSDLQEAIALNKVSQRFRVKVTRKPGFDFISGKALAVMTMSKFMRELDEYTDYYHSIGKNTSYWAEKGHGKEWSTGQIMFDAYNNRYFDLDKLRAVIPTINKKLRTYRIDSIYETYDKQDDIDLKMWNFYMFNSELPVTKFQLKLPLWKNTIKVSKSRMETVPETVHDPSLIQPVLMSGGKGTIGVIALPIRYNPSLFLSAILGTTSHKAILKVTEYHSLLTAKFSNTICPISGKDHELIDLATGKKLGFGRDVFMRKALGATKNYFLK
jgi:intein/homing endonuclease